MKNRSELSGCDRTVGNAEWQSVRSPDVTADILQNEGKSKRQQQAVHRVAVVDSADHQPFDDEAKYRGEDRRDDQRAPEADEGGQHKGDVAAEGEEVAVGEVDDVAEIEDQREAQRHQHVEGADDQSVGDVEQDELKHWPPPPTLPREGEGKACVRPGGSSCSRCRRPVPAACSPGTNASTLKTLSGLPSGGCASPTKMFGHQLDGRRRDSECCQAATRHRAAARGPPAPLTSSALPVTSPSPPPAGPNGPPHSRTSGAHWASCSSPCGSAATNFTHLGHVRLVPPPFHVPPAGLRILRHRLDAFQLEQRAAERHVLRSCRTARTASCSRSARGRPYC